MRELLKYKIVDDSERSRESNYEDDPGVKALLSGKTLMVDGFPKSSTYYNIAKRHNKKLRTRAVQGSTSTIVWMDDIPAEVPITEVDPEKVTA